MKTIKPTKQYSMTVVPYRPYRKILIIFALSFTFLVAVIGSFLLGRYYSLETKGITGTDQKQFKPLYEKKVEEVGKLEQQVANLKLATEVDRKANEEVRAQVVELKMQLAEMEQDNTFYRSLMRPNTSDQGLIIDAPSISAIAGSDNKYRYNVVIKQIVAQHRQLSGYLEFEILGREESGPRRLALKDVSESVSKEQIKLRFKYFQPVKGEMTLPEGFVPERIELKVVIKLPKKVVLEKKFGWLVKEG